MPKRINVEEDELEEEEDLEDGEEDMFPNDVVRRPKRKTRPIRTREVDDEEEDELPIARPMKKEPVKRFLPFKQEQSYGIIDAESKETLASGSTPEETSLQLLADILERLERIETNLGAMLK